jgi:RND family efflux transporter MFP subunit
VNRVQVTQQFYLAALVLLAGCGSPESAANAAAGSAAEATASETVRIPVRVVTAESRRAMPSIVMNGTLGAKEEIPLAFKVGGVVTRIRVEAGQAVREGDVLAEISLAEIDAQVSAAREGRDKAQRDFARAERLAADSVVTRSQLEDARTQLDVAAAQLRAAEFNRRYAVIRAPAAGLVLRRQLEVGQLVGANTPVLLLRSARKGLVLRAAAADRDAVRITVGEPAAIEFDAFPGREFSGRVERVAISATPMTGTYEVEIAVEPGELRLASGLIGRATITPQSVADLPMVPAEALLEVDGASATVFVLDAAGETAHRVRVRVAFLDGAFAAIGEGLPPGARVVTAGATRLMEGTPVSVTAERTP